MAHNISEELMLIINLKHVALDHKQHCETNCNVSLIQLRMAAENIARWVRTWERKEAARCIEEMPII